MPQPAGSTSTVAGPEPDRHRPKPPWLGPVVATAGVLLVLAVVLVRPGGTVAAADTEHVVPSGLATLAADGDGLRQPFVATADGLSTLSIRLTAFDHNCSVTARLQRGTALVAEQRTPCDELGVGTLVDVLVVEPLDASAGERFALLLSNDGPDPVLVATGRDTPDGLPPVEGDTDGDRQASVELHADYGGGGSVAAQLDDAVDRLSAGRPWWQHPAGLVITVLAALGTLVALTVARGRTATWLLVAFIVAKGLVWTAIIPPFQSPDEPAHFAYSQFLADAHRLPERDVETIDAPLLYSPQVHALTDLVHMQAAAEGDRPDYSSEAKAALAALADLPRQSVSPDGNGAAAGYPPAYYLPGAVLYVIGPDRVDHAVQWVRLTSIGFAVALGLAARALGRRLFQGSDAAAIGLAVAVSAQPMISQQSATVNNDAMVLAAGAWALVAAVELLRPVPERWPRLAFWAAFAVGASMLAKNFAAGFAVVVFLGWLVGRIRTERDDRPAIVREALLAVGGMAVTFGTWFVITVVSGFQAAALADFDQSAVELTLTDYLRTLRDGRFRLVRENLIGQMWGDFGWLRAPLPPGVEAAITVALVAAALVTLAWLVRVAADIVGRRRRCDWSGFDVVGPSGGVLMLAAVGATLVLLYGVQFQIFTESGGLYILQGRYFLVMVPALLALPIAAVQGLAPNRRLAVPTATAVAAASVVLNIVSIAVVVEHFYL